jgi:hypothetical protein
MLRKRVRTILHHLGWLVFISALLIVSANGQSAAPTPTPQARKETHRWLDLDLFSISTRYRFIETANGQTNSNQQQWQFMARGRFKFDRSGRYSVVATLATGNSFTGGWNNTGLGTGDPQTNIFPKQLYFDAKPVKSLEFQFGGIGVNNGENTEITGYDNDAYITGERLQIRKPKKLYFDEISFTNGYVGDLNRPSVFRRFKHLDKSNYHQFLVRKQITKKVGFSADYTFESGVDTLRQAIKIKLPKSHFVDSLLYENYERIDPHPGYGFALIGDKKLFSKLTLVGGFIKISHPMFNSDCFPRGERICFSAAYKITNELTLNPVIIRAVGPLLTSSTPRTRFEIVASYNILEAFHHYRIF